MSLIAKRQSGILRAAADKTGAVTLAYVDIRGNVLASATRDRLRNIPQASYFQRAMTGALGVAHGFDPVFQIRSYYYAAPYFGRAGCRCSADCCGRCRSD